MMIPSRNAVYRTRFMQTMCPRILAVSRHFSPAQNYSACALCSRLAPSQSGIGFAKRGPCFKHRFHKVNFPTQVVPRVWTPRRITLDVTSGPACNGAGIANADAARWAVLTTWRSKLRACFLKARGCWTWAVAMDSSPITFRH